MLSDIFHISALLLLLKVLAAALFAVQQALFGVLKALFPVRRHLLFLLKTKTIFFLEKRVFPKQRLNFHYFQATAEIFVPGEVQDFLHCQTLLVFQACFICYFCFLGFFPLCSAIYEVAPRLVQSIEPEHFGSFNFNHQKMTQPPVLINIRS